MRGMKDSVAFATAQLAEDESAAKAAASVAGPVWEFDEAASWVTSPRGTFLADTKNPWNDEEIGPFAARHDPARALREVEAGRRIFERHRSCPSGDGYDDMWTGPGPCPDLADLLYRWADRPDYDQEWKPQGS